MVAGHRDFERFCHPTFEEWELTMEHTVLTCVQESELSNPAARASRNLLGG